MKKQSEYYTHGEEALRAAIDEVASQLAVGVDSRFDFTVKAGVADETLDKLAMLINFVVEAARRALSDLREKNERLSELDRLKSAFLANVSHELRTPLALVLGPTEKWLASPSTTGEERQDLEVVRRNARGLLKTVNDLLDVSKLEAGKVAPRYASIDLALVVRQTSSLFECLARERGVAYTVDAPGALVAEIDRQMIEKVLANLLSNAFKFGPEAGRVWCALEAGGGTAVLRVQDNGPGIPKGMRERIFERFVRVEDDRTSRRGGTGLGLAIVKEMVELHRGAIEVVDPPGGGTLFVVTLPLRAPSEAVVWPDEAPAAPAATEVAEQAHAAVCALPAGDLPISDSGAERGLVLVVEDNPEMSRFIAEALRGEYGVVLAFDGRQGLARAVEHRPDLILSDVMMPEMSGDRMLAELRRLPELAGVPIVFLTAKADDELRVRLLAEGADDYVMKPFMAEELRARVRNLVTAKRSRDILQAELHSATVDLAQLAREVTLERHALEEALEEARASRDEVKRLLQIRDELISVAGHELRAPLTPLHLQRQLLQRLMASPDVPQAEKEKKIAHYLEVTRRQLQILTSLVDTLMDLSRIRQGTFAIDAEPEVDLGTLVREVVESYRPQWEAAGSRVLLETDGAPKGRWDRLRLGQVAANLLSNAIKYGKGNPIEVSVSGDERGSRVVVRDHGIGIPREDRARIFNRFERSAPIKSFGGLGLGLYITRRIVDAHGGVIHVESEPGKGSTFTVELPPAPS
jgi:signal transduction histidine kinase